MMQEYYKPVLFASSRIEEMMFKTTLDLNTMQGDIIVNVSIVNTDDLERVLETMDVAFNSGLSISPFLRLIDSGETIGNLKIMPEQTGIVTMCSITIDGLFLRAGILTNPKLGGIVQIHNGLPVRFTDVLTYTSTTSDPLEILLSQDITSVLEMLHTGSGKILANLREVHMSARDEIDTILYKMMETGISGILEVGNPNTHVLDVPVERDHLGVVAIGGTNPMAIVKEQGIYIHTNAMSTIVDINSMGHIGDFI
jgi:repressor of nif and glnA expression